MSLDLPALREAVARHGRVARVVVAATQGSVPREVGAAMLVWQDGDGIGQSGTIGGGALEYEAARAALSHKGLSRHPLGPALGQCCGGSVTLLTEHYDASAVAGLDGPAVHARGPGDPPLAVARLLDRARARGETPPPQLVGDWMVEPVTARARPLWVWGAGHVGRAIVGVMAPLPGLAVTWVDTAPERFPAHVPDGVTPVPAARPEALMPRAPKDAAHLILTYSHALDLDLCHAALSHGFGFCGLIGSKTKWARFRKRLSALGHADGAIDRIACPIGDPGLGKHPQAIAIGVAAQLVSRQQGGGQAWPTHFSASRG